MLPLLLAAVTLVPLHGMPLAGPTHLRLLVAAKPPFVYDVDHHRVTPMRVRVPSTGLYATGLSRSLTADAVPADPGSLPTGSRPTGRAGRSRSLAIPRRRGRLPAPSRCRADHPWPGGGSSSR
jgi:hypothetical protein